jgi:2-polyprenyl-3-methyl-5-hydroxy-6-metoxy-1,4-benzoquinol methylase
MGLGRIRSGYGFDISATSIDAARLMARSPVFQHMEPVSLTFERLGATDPWIQEKFDVVALIDVMHHVPPASQRQLLQLTAEHMKPGGLLLYKDMVNRPFWRATSNRLHDLILARQLIHYAPITNIEAWAADFGLVLIEGKTINRLWYGHELRVFRNPAQQL